MAKSNKIRTKKSKSKNLLKFLTSRLFIFAMLILIQVSIFVLTLVVLGNYSVYFNIFSTCLSLVICFYIVTKDQSNPAYKLAWIIPTLTFPIIGGFLYLLFGKRNVSKRIKTQLEKTYQNSRSQLPDNSDVVDEIKAQSESIAKESMYIKNASYFPIWKNTNVEYLSPGEIKFDRLVEELKKAKKFIFLEYFIIEKGIMWNTILDILKQKAKDGVEVKVMYDDLGTIQLLPSKYFRELQSYGIECTVFNPFRPSVDTFMNYRDHRKIVVIDGNVGFTGGINLADEYINAYEKYGYWKDCSIVMEGSAVWNLTVLFLDLWKCSNVKSEDIDYDRYKPTLKSECEGYVQPFGDSPTDSQLVGELAYTTMINNANKYVYICTPYLILDNEMLTSLKLASQSGVDIRIVTPSIPDKFYVHAVTRSNYLPLIESGIRIYEYTPGFIHSKSLVCDDELAIIGTTNFDFRSFYLHFECGVFMYKSKAIQQARDDFDNILSVSREITLSECKNINPIIRFVRAICKLFSPLM